MERSRIVLADRTQGGRMSVLIDVMVVVMEYSNRYCQQVAGKRKRCPCSMVLHIHGRIIEVFTEGSSIVRYSSQD